MTFPKNKETLLALLQNGKLEPYVRHIRFPQYKNLASNTRVDFSYPITALVGANGTNKSSILRAIWGAPGYNNLGNFWFSTSTDPIEETGQRPSCFIYGYLNASENQVVEVIKTRSYKEEDPDYWEPSRPLIGYEMTKMPPLLDGQPVPEGRSKTRWKTIEKNVVYLDFRAALSAFDKFFYHGELTSKVNTEKNKKEFIRTRAPHLKSKNQGSPAQVSEQFATRQRQGRRSDDQEAHTGKPDDGGQVRRSQQRGALRRRMSHVFDNTTHILSRISYNTPHAHPHLTPIPPLHLAAPRLAAARV